MPTSTLLEMPSEEHRQILAALRRARYGSRLALHILLWCAAGRTPTEIAAVLCCSRSSGDPHRAHHRAGPDAAPLAAGRAQGAPAGVWLVPHALARCPLALTRQATRGRTVAAETMRRWVHEVGWVWKRATLVATDDDPHRVDRLARIRVVDEHLRLWEALVCAAALEIQLRPTVGDAWTPQGTQVKVMTAGTNEKHDLAGALELATGTMPHGLGPRKTNALGRELLERLDDVYPATHDTRVSVVVDHDQIHQAKAVEPWLATHSRVERLLLPTYGPRANPIARAFGDVHDCCTRDHRRQRLRDLVADVVEPLHVNGLWPYQRSDIYHEPAVTAAVESMAMEQTLATAS